MKYMKQFGIIILIALAGEFLEKLLPLPVPGSIYGLGIMLALLMSGLLKVEAVKESADFLIEIMPLMFIPAAVGLLDSYHELEGIFLPLAAVVAVTTVVVMAVTGKCAQSMIRKGKKDTDMTQKKG
ncbi:MAG: CidA/LrgA family protein [Lachnospiraceae bacterium]|jgi:holin-like protein|nr:hypothetical protein C807_02090 [Lachnospiraceae bacterium 28-4]MCI8846001.1 CidA/LrgA family protein [Lachnospiraceae bacterium]